MEEEWVASTYNLFSDKDMRNKEDDDIADMRNREDAEQKFRKKLKKEGHTCVMIKETYPSKTIWCHEKVCKGVSNE